MVNQETLALSLKQLRLSTIRASWEEVAQHAVEGLWTYPQYLANLCNREVASREQRKIDRSIVDSKLPIGKTLDSFEFRNLSSITGAQISSLATNTDWIKRATNLIIFGPSGVGKTHLAAAIGRQLAMLGVRVLFAKTTALVQKLQLSSNEHKLSEMLTKLARYDLLILDDFGYVKKTEAETSVLFELIADRYETKSLLITCNQAFDQWDAIFPNNTMAVAAIDRLVHHATIMNINEASFRKASRMGK